VLQLVVPALGPGDLFVIIASSSPQGLVASRKPSLPQQALAGLIVPGFFDRMKVCSVPNVL
jgi:hypothetical protein